MKLLFDSNPQLRECPQCKTVGKLRRSRAKNMREQIIRTISILKLYRCGECGWRGFRSTLVFTKKSFKTAIVYLFLIIITAFIANFALKKIIH